MRIGIVTQSYYPRYGGVTENAHNTAVELRRRGHEVTIITSRFRENIGYMFRPTTSSGTARSPSHCSSAAVAP